MRVFGQHFGLSIQARRSGGDAVAERVVGSDMAGGGEHFLAGQIADINVPFWANLKSSREKVPSLRFDLSMTGMCGSAAAEAQRFLEISGRFIDPNQNERKLVQNNSGPISVEDDDSRTHMRKHYAHRYLGALGCVVVALASGLSLSAGCRGTGSESAHFGRPHDPDPVKAFQALVCS